MKKWLSVLLCISIIATVTMSVTTFAFATEVNAQDIPPSFVLSEKGTAAFFPVINEYDVYVRIRQTPTEQLICRGLSLTAVQIVKSDSIENELTSLSKLSSDELIALGYSQEQILLIHNYSGERIESNPELRGIFADLSAEVDLDSASTSSITVKLTYTWSNPPLISGNGVLDVVAATWQGTNSAGQPLNVAADPSASATNVNIQYCSRRDNTYHHSTAATVQYENAYEHCYAYIQMGSPQTDGNGNTYYAHKTVFTVKIDKTGTDSIQEVAFCFKYGHTEVNFTPTVSFSGDLSIGFSSLVEEMSTNVFRVTSSGSLVEY